MKIKSRFPKRYSVSILLSAMTLAVVGSFQPANAADSNYYQFNDKGELVLPAGFSASRTTPVGHELQARVQDHRLEE